MPATQRTTNAVIITANLEALHIRLQYATRLAGAASVAMAEHNQNRAVGTIIEPDYPYKSAFRHARLIGPV